MVAVTIRAAPEVAATLVAPLSQYEDPKSELYLGGRSTRLFVAGAILEAAYVWHNRHLLFLTNDAPYEESLHIYLLGDACSRIIDSARVLAPYATAIFSDAAIRAPDTVVFRFLGDTLWSVRLLERTGWRLPFLSESLGVVRPWGVRRHFVVSDTGVRVG